jgi:predicted ATPase/class 3 adenylate cyclase
MSEKAVPEQQTNLLHHFGPYLPADRFRSIVAGRELPVASTGAVLLADISGYTPLTSRLVDELGPQQASEALHKRLNPMFEALAGQVFHKGGSVLRFLGDGFIGWFDEEFPVEIAPTVSATARAACAANEMMQLMQIFRDLELRVAIGYGHVSRWAIGSEQHGMVDIIVGPAVNDATHAAQPYKEPGVVLSTTALTNIADIPEIGVEVLPRGECRLGNIDNRLLDQARAYRWPAWEVHTDIEEAIYQTALFVPPIIENQVKRGFGRFVNELRYASPVFIQFGDIDYDHDEYARSKLNSYLKDVQEVLVETGGQLISVELSDKGSVIYSLFGAPVSYRNDTVRAIQAALGLQLLPQRHTTINWQSIGISRGLLYTGTVGGEVRHEYTAIGDSTNLAARLMVAAGKNQILVSNDVRAEAEQEFEWKQLEPIQVKGREEPVRIAQPMRRRYNTKVIRRFGEVYGRDKEIEKYTALLEQAKAGSSQIIRISGQNGVGKSYLAGEFLNLAVGFGCRVTRGSCMSLGSQIPYLPWRAIIEDLLDFRPDWTDSERVHGIINYLDKYHPGLLPRWVLFADLLGLKVDVSMNAPAHERDRQLHAVEAVVTDLIYEIAEQQPICLLIEDTHWLDEISENLIIALVKEMTLKPASIVLILVHRPISDILHLPRILDVLRAQRRQTHFELQEIDEGAVSQVIEERLGAPSPPELTRFIYEKTRGNTFFVQEMVDALRSTRAVLVYGKSVFIEEDLETIDLPHTVTEMSQSRIDSLTEDEKLVLKVAAVIGAQFEIELMVRSMPVARSYDEVRNILTELQEREFLQRDTVSGKYSFQHAILQDVTYNTMLAGQREQLHQTVGLALEKLEPDAYEQLAHHFFNTSDRDSALRYCIQAGMEAKNVSANLSALRFFEKAMTLIQDQDTAFQIISEKVKVLFRIGDLEKAKQNIDDARRIVRRSGRVDWRAQLDSFSARYHYQMSAWEFAIQGAQRVLNFALAANDLQLMWHSYDILRSTYRQLNQPQKVFNLTARMQVVAAELDDPFRTMLLLLDDLDELHLSYPERAEQGLRSAYEEIKSLNSMVTEGRYWQVMANVYTRKQDFPQALDAYQRQLDLWQKVGNQRMEGHALNNIGQMLIQLGQLTEGNNYLQWAFRLLNQANERFGEADTLAALGLLADRYKAYDEAAAYIKRALAVYARANARISMARLSFILGNVKLNHGDLEEAQLNFQRAIGISEELDDNPSYSEYQLGMAHYWILRGDKQKADLAVQPGFEALLAKFPYEWVDLGLAYWRTIGILRAIDRNVDADEIYDVFEAFIENTMYYLETIESPQDIKTRIPYYHDLIETKGHPNIVPKAPPEASADNA